MESHSDKKKQQHSTTERKGNTAKNSPSSKGKTTTTKKNSASSGASSKKVPPKKAPPKKAPIKKEEPKKQGGLSFFTWFLLLLVLFALAFVGYRFFKESLPFFSKNSTAGETTLPLSSEKEPPILPSNPKPTPIPTIPQPTKPIPPVTPTPTPTPSPSPLPITSRIALVMPEEKDYIKKEGTSSFGVSYSLTYYIPKLSVPYDKTLEENLNGVIALKYGRLADQIFAGMKGTAISTDLELHPLLYKSPHYISLYLEYEKPADGGGNMASYAFSLNFDVQNTSEALEVQLEDLLLDKEAFLRSVKQNIGGISASDHDIFKRKYLSFYPEETSLTVIYNGGTLNLNDYSLLKVEILDRTIFKN